MLSIHLTKPPSQGAKPHCAPTGLSLRGCGRPEAMTLAVCAEVFLGRASDRSIPWQQEASLPGTAQAPFLTGDGGWQEHGPGTSKPHLRKHTRETPRAGPAPRPAPAPAPAAQPAPVQAPTCSATSLLMARASCSCSSSSPLVWGRACSSSEDTLGEVAAGERQSHYRQGAGSRSTATPRPHLTPAGSGRAPKGCDYCKVRIE